MTEMFDQSPPGLPKDLGPLVGALDQGTSSTRFLVFVANTGELVTFHRYCLFCHHDGIFPTYLFYNFKKTHKKMT